MLMVSLSRRLLLLAGLPVLFAVLQCSPAPGNDTLPPEPTPILLKQGWQLFPGEFCSGPDCTGEAIQDAPLLLDGEYSHIKFGTYVLSIDLPGSWQDRALAVQLYDVGSAYRFLVNGTVYHEQGVLATEAERSNAKPDVVPVLVPFGKHQNLVLAVQFSNYNHPRGGLRNPPLMGPGDQVRMYREQSLIRNLLAAGIILGMALYHFGLFLNRTSDRAALLFGLVCLCYSVRLLFTDEVMVRVFLDPGYRLQTAVEYISFIMAGPLFVYFLTVTFPVRGSRWLAASGMALGLAGSLFVSLTPVPLYAEYLWLFHILILYTIICCLAIWVMALAGCLPGSLISFIGGLLACLTAVNDVFYFRRESPVGPIFHYGLLFFILAQSYLLSRLFALTYDGVRRLSESLKNTNHALTRFVPSEFLRMLGRTDITEVKLGDQVERPMTVMFSDIRAFTTLSERMSPAENFNFLNSYLKRMTPVVTNRSGFIDKYIGDAVMALFPADPKQALAAAIDMQREIRVYNRHRALKGYEPISIGIGVHTGDIMLGIIGHENRMEGTVISDAVNTASRVERLTRKYGVMIVVSDATVSSLPADHGFDLRMLGRVRVRGRSGSMRVYHLLNGYSEDVRALYMNTRTDFDLGVEKALAGDFSAARSAFERVMEVNPMDTAARFYLERMERASPNVSPVG
jgi:adenylate cyclase